MEVVTGAQSLVVGQQDKKTSFKFRTSSFLLSRGIMFRDDNVVATVLSVLAYAEPNMFLVVRLANFRTTHQSISTTIGD